MGILSEDKERPGSDNSSVQTGIQYRENDFLSKSFNEEVPTENKVLPVLKRRSISQGGDVNKALQLKMMKLKKEKGDMLKKLLNADPKMKFKVQMGEAFMRHVVMYHAALNMDIREKTAKVKLIKDEFCDQVVREVIQATKAKSVPPPIAKKSESTPKIKVGSPSLKRKETVEVSNVDDASRATVAKMPFELRSKTPETIKNTIKKSPETKEPHTTKEKNSKF